MKFLSFIILAAIFTAETNAATVILSGDAVLFSFSNLAGPNTCQTSFDPDTGHTICPAELKRSEIQFMLSPSDVLTGSERLRVSYFENSTGDAHGAWSVRDYLPSDIVGNAISDSFVGFLPPPYSAQPWVDLQGVFLVEALNGSVSIAGVGVSLWDSLGKFEGQATVSAVPLPATAWLFGSGLLGVMMSRVTRLGRYTKLFHRSSKC